jgi:hypothetical protein
MKKTILFLLVAVLGLSAWHLRPAKDEMAGWWENEALRTELSGRLSVAKFKLEAAGNVRTPEELDAIVSANAEREARIATLKAKRLDLGAALVRGEAALVKLGEDHLRQLKERAIGKQWAELVTADRTYLDAKVVSVTDAGVTIRHRDGSARLRYKDLTPSQRHEFGLDEASGIAATAEERKQAQAYEQWVEDQVAASEREKASASRLLAPAPRAAAPRPVSAPIVSANVAPVKNPLKEPARQFGNGSRYYYGDYGSYYRPRRTTIYYYYNAPRYCAPSYPRSYARPVPGLPASPLLSSTP